MVTLPQSRKENILTKYELLNKGGMDDYTDMTYKEAVTRLRYLLNESYVLPSSLNFWVKNSKQEDIEEESKRFLIVADKTKPLKINLLRRPSISPKIYKKLETKIHEPFYEDDDSEIINQPEVIAFIERQEEYIDQLEKEAKYCRDELSQLLTKVKELIAENESLQEQQKSGLIKVMLESTEEETLNNQQSPKKLRKRLEGPLIIFESRISELEAQLTQCKIDLRKAQEEVSFYKKKYEECSPSSNYDFYKEIENLQREKRDLSESLAKLQISINQIREKEIDASKKVQRTLDVVDKTQFEKQQAEMEVYRLKSELELQHDKLLEVLSEQTRKVSEERNQAERRYLQHVERLNAELTAQRDTLSKMQMEIEKHVRIEEDLKRDLTTKNLTIENVKKELNSKIGSLQKDLAAALAERDCLEQEISTTKMSSERLERLNKQESNRLQVEISALKKRLDGGDVELIHSQKENLRLLEKISALENELTLYKIKLGEQKDPIEEEQEKAKEKIWNARISEIEAKHVERVSELESLIENQSQVMTQLKTECQFLSQKLEESTAHHKEEMETVQIHISTLKRQIESSLGTPQWTTFESIKEQENTTLKKNGFTPMVKDRKLDNLQIKDEDKFLIEELQQDDSIKFNQNHNNQNQNQFYLNSKLENLDGNYNIPSSYRENSEGINNDVRPDIDTFKEEGSNNNHFNYYNNEQQLLTYNDQQFLTPEQISSVPDQQIYTEKQNLYEQSTLAEPHIYQEQQPSYTEEKLYLEEEPLHQEQSNFQGQILSDEIYLSQQEVVPTEVISPKAKEISSEQKQIVEPPKTKFQRAAELSRFTSKSEDSTRGKSTFTKPRNPQLIKNPQKSQSRFK